MTIRNSMVWFLGICSVSFAGGLGCQHAQPSPPSNARVGTIDFVVRQSPNSTDAVARGSFDVHGIDNDEHTRVGIGHGTPRQLHVRLPAGTYALDWNPTSPADVADQVHSQSARDGAEQEWPQIVVVTPDTATIVDVIVIQKATHTEPRMELASAGTRGAP
jgi:hypothetical protein